MLAQRLPDYDDDHVRRDEYVADVPVKLRRRRRVFDADRKQEIRDALWLFLAIAHECSGEEIAEVCRFAAKHKAHIARELKRIRKEAVDNARRSGITASFSHNGVRSTLGMPPQRSLSAR